MGQFSRVPIPFVDMAFLEYFVPEPFRGTNSVEALRARVLTLSTLAIVVWSPVFLVFFALQGATTLAALMLVLTLFVVPAPLVFLATHSFHVAGHVLTGGLLIAILVVSWFSGGLDSPGLFWVPVATVPAYMFGTKRSFRVWAAIALVSGFGFVALDAMALVPASLLDAEAHGDFSIILLVSLILVIPQLFVLNSGLQTWLADRLHREAVERRRAAERLRAAQEQALETSRRSAQAVMDRSPDGIVVFRDGTILRANPAFGQMLGLQSSEPLGESLLAGWVAQNERAEFARILQRIEAGEDVGLEEFCFLNSTGETVVAEVTGVLATHEHQPAGYCLLRDVTERREWQSRMMQMDRMIAVGTLAAGVAHEINNPLAYVHSNTEYLLAVAESRATDDDTAQLEELLEDEEMLEVLTDIREGSLRIRNIVSDLSTFSTSGDGEVMPLDVREIARSSLKMAENQLRHRARISTSFERVPAVEVNESNMAQVILNLLINAAQAIPEGAVDENQIDIVIRYDESGDRVLIEVSDTGEGIPADIRPRIFDPFFSTKGDTEDGMGLGLSICRNIVQAHDGELTFETEAGEGTTFRISLPPVMASPEESGIFESPVLSVEQRGRVLIVDDEAGVRRTIERVLRDKYEVDTAESGRAALDAIAEAGGYSLIICDLLMPEVSGVELYETLERRYPELVDRVVFITGGTFTEATREFVERVDQPVVEKPFDITEFRDIADTVVREGASSPPAGSQP